MIIVRIGTLSPSPKVGDWIQITNPHGYALPAQVVEYVNKFPNVKYRVQDVFVPKEDHKNQLWVGIETPYYSRSSSPLPKDNLWYIKYGCYKIVEGI